MGPVVTGRTHSRTPRREKVPKVGLRKFSFGRQDSHRQNTALLAYEISPSQGHSSGEIDDLNRFSGRDTTVHH